MTAAARLVEDLSSQAIEDQRRIDLLLSALLTYQGKCSETTQHSDQVLALYQRSLDLLKSLNAELEQALPWHGLGYLAHMKGDYKKAYEYFQTSLHIYESLGDTWACASVYNYLSLVTRRQGNFAEAKSFCLQGLRIRRELGDQRGVASSLNSLGLIHCALGEYEAAKEVLAEGLAICQHIDHLIGVGNALTGLVQANYYLGDLDGASRCVAESLQVYQDIGDRWGVAIAYHNLGSLESEQGHYGRAAPYYEQSIAVYRQIGIKSGLANSIGHLGETYFYLDRFEEARQQLNEALDLALNIEAFPIVLRVLTTMALLNERDGFPEAGMLKLAYVLQHPAATKADQKKAQENFDQMTHSLSTLQIKQLMERARQMPLEDIITVTDG